VASLLQECHMIAARWLEHVYPIDPRRPWVDWRFRGRIRVTARDDRQRSEELRLKSG
jgi:hypothetical protein